MRALTEAMLDFPEEEVDALHRDDAAARLVDVRAALDEVLALCDRWEIRASVIGRVTTTGRFRVYDGLFDGRESEALCDVPAESLGDGPVYDRPVARPANQDALAAADPLPALVERFPAGADLGPELLGLLGLPNIGDSSWVWRQYDHQLFLNTVAGPGPSDAAVLRLKHPADHRLITFPMFLMSQRLKSLQSIALLTKPHSTVKIPHPKTLAFLNQITNPMTCSSEIMESTPL